jgi:choloylglycine hydrolase
MLNRLPCSAAVAALTLGLGVALSGPAAACTGISLPTVAGQSVHARTIEWGSGPLDSRLIIAPRGIQLTSELPGDKRGVSWTNRYGYVGVSLVVDHIIGEGMNEAGLNAGLFYFPGYGGYAPYDPEDTARNLSEIDVTRWMLGQFATVAEVRAALATVTIAPPHLDEEGRAPPTVHWRVTDAKGESVVIEIIDGGKVQIYDNPVGVITNSPGFPWHLTNLNNLVNVQPGTLPARDMGEQRIFSFGAGTAAMGLPGDFSPPSRFLRAAFFRNTAPAAETPVKAVEQAFQILSNFDIPIGTVFAPADRASMPAMPSATHWTAVSDPNELKFYFTTMNDRRVKVVELRRVDFDGDSIKTYPIDAGRFVVEDATPR